MRVEEDKSDQVDHNHEVVDKSKRKFSKAGIAAPVILTLAGRPVVGYGALCLSQHMSGNMSYTGSGSCVLGMSPTEWKGPGGFVKSTSVPLIQAGTSPLGVENTKTLNKVNATWQEQETAVFITITKTIVPTTTPYFWANNISKYGDLIINIVTISITKFDDGSLVNSQVTVANLNEIIIGTWDEEITEGKTYTPGVTTVNANGGSIDGVSCSDYSGGDTFPGTSTSMREVLCVNTGSEESHFVAAFLNARYYNGYVLSVDEVIKLKNGAINVPPGFLSKSAFLSATWENIQQG